MRSKQALNTVERVYRADTMNKLQFGYVRGYMNANPKATFRDAMKSFRDDFGLNEDEWPTASARVDQRRMELSFLGIKYEKKCKQK
jgi:hypothetical protein